MGFSKLRYCHLISNCVAGISGLMFTGFLVFVIQRIGNKELKKYNHIIMQSCIIDIIFSVVNLIAKPLTVANYDLGITMLDSFIDFSNDLSRTVVVCVWQFMMLFSISALPISFYYRYRILCLKQNFSVQRHVVCLTGAIVNSGIFVGHYYYAEVYRTSYFLDMSEVLSNHFGDQTGKVNAVALLGFEDSYMFVFLFHSCVVAIGSFAIIFWCSWKMWKFLKLHKNNANSKFNKVQAQLTKTLLFQALIPIFTFLLPVISVNVATLLPITPDPNILAVINFTIAYIPAVNALSLLVFVKSYRSEVSNLLKKNGPMSSAVTHIF